MTPQSLHVLSRYHAWANQRLYDACGQLSEEEFVAARPSFFGSIMATLNHALVGDILWMGRLTGDASHGIAALDHILHRDFATLAAERRRMDEVVLAHCASLEGDLDRPFAYATIKGTPTTTPLGLTLLHLFNHGTHHRGQVHDMLSATTVAPPTLDLVYFLRL